jgi:hypothetical protein
MIVYMIICIPVEGIGQKKCLSGGIIRRDRVECPMGLSYKDFQRKRRESDPLGEPYQNEKGRIKLKSRLAGKKRRWLKENVLSFVSEAVFFDLTIERSQSDIEQAGRLGLISFRVIEYPLDMEFFHAGQVKGGQRAIGLETGDL